MDITPGTQKTELKKIGVFWQELGCNQFYTDNVSKILKMTCIDLKSK